MQILLKKDRLEEARELIAATDLPEETHPAAMAQWLAAQALFHLECDEMDAAHTCIDMAYDIAPDSPAVQALYDQIHPDDDLEF